MATPFVKMHGLGNDFVLFDAREAPLALAGTQVRRLADRRTGIGFDQLFVLEPSSRADAFMRIWNADGGEVGACGNGARCVAAYLGEHSTIETAAGLLSAETDGEVAVVDMGQPRFAWSEVPLAYPMDTREMPVGWGGLDRPSALSMGNPHVVFFVDDIDAVPLEGFGPAVEHDPLFPERVNVNVAHVLDPGRIRLKVWERGAGATLACGTGACATAVAAMRRGLVGRRVTLALPGGDLGVEWRDDGHVLLSGPAVTAYRGTVDLARYA